MHALSLTVLSASVLLQVAAAVSALRLIRLTGHKRAWSLMAAALGVMALRRILTLVRVSAGMPLTPIDVLEEAVEVSVSGLVLASVWGIAPIFQSIRAGWEAAVNAEKRYRKLFEHASDAILIFEPDSEVILQANPMAGALYGYPCEELVGLSLKALTRDVPRGERQVREILHAGWYHNFNSVHLKRDGTPLHVLVNSAKIDYEGRPAILSVNRDITQWRRAEERRLASEVRLRYLVQAGPAVIYTCEASGNYDATFVSENAQRILGHDPQDYVRFPGFWADHIHPEERDAVFSGLGELSKSDRYGHEYRFQHKDGSYRWMRDDLVLIRDAEGRPLEIIGAWYDITERKRAEEALRDSERRYRLLFERNQAAIFRTTMDGTILDCNEAYATLLGFASCDEIRAHKTADFYWTPEDREALIARMKTEGGVAGVEMRLRRKDGSVLWALENAIVRREDDGEEILHGTFLDISDRKRAEEALKESEEKYRTVFEGVAEGIFRTTPEGRVLMANPALVRMLGYDSLEALLKRDLEGEGYVDPAERRRFREIMDREGIVRGFATEWRRPDRTSLHVIENARALRGEDGQILAYEGTVQDVTHRVEMERSLAQAKKLETIGMIAGGVAHEVRNPLFAISTIVAALDRKLSDQPRFAEYVTHIAEQTRRLNGLMEDLLSLGRPVDPSQFLPLAMGDLLDETLSQMAKGDPRSIERIAGDRPAEQLRVSGIAPKLVQVFQNLLQNALAFSPDGAEIHLRCWREDRWVGLAVTDSGPGIPADMMDRLFEPFASRRKGGTGLGLAIVRKIVSAHGGRVEAVNNDPPPGASFTVRLPRL